MIAIFMPRKKNPSVQYRLSKAQQNRVVRQCEEINSLIREVHDNLSDIRRAGTATSQLARETHAKHLKGRHSLRQQQLECERINSELRKITEDMRAVRENVARASQHSYLTVNRARELEKNVSAMAAPQPVDNVSAGLEVVTADVVPIAAVRAYKAHTVCKPRKR